MHGEKFYIPVCIAQETKKEKFEHKKEKLNTLYGKMAKHKL